MRSVCLSFGWKHCTESLESSSVCDDECTRTQEYGEQETKHSHGCRSWHLLTAPDAHRQRVIVNGIDYGQVQGLHLGPRAGGVNGEVHRVDGVAQGRRQDVADHRLQLLLVLVHRLDGTHAIHRDANLYK